MEVIHMAWVNVQSIQKGSKVYFEVKVSDWEWDNIKLGYFDFKYMEGYYKKSTKPVKKIKTFLNKLWTEYPEASIDTRPIEKAKEQGKQEMEQQKIIWEYQDTARQLKSENNYSAETYKKLFNRAAELEKYLVANNLQNEIIYC